MKPCALRRNTTQCVEAYVIDSSQASALSLFADVRGSVPIGESHCTEFALSMQRSIDPLSPATFQQRDTVCANCEQPIPLEDIDVVPRVPCSNCGVTARIFRLSIEERLAAGDECSGEKVELSAETSATAMAISSVVMPNMDGFWREASELKAVMLRDQGSDEALRAIASGAFDPGELYPFEARTKKITQFVADEILRQRQDAKDRIRDASIEAREQRRGLLGWIDRLVGWTRGLFGA